MVTGIRVCRHSPEKCLVFQAVVARQALVWLLLGTGNHLFSDCHGLETGLVNGLRISRHLAGHCFMVPGIRHCRYLLPDKCLVIQAVRAGQAFVLF
jgi:hypothetical protein